MTQRTMRLVNFDSEAFVRDYWQKAPLLIRNPWADWSNPLEPDELAGLACESDTESRLVTQDNGSWGFEQGPFATSRFDEPGTAPWTLLVQSVDHHNPDVAALIEPFRFLPDWRIDDVMVSYAVDGGGVGAHFDQYDVFLVQGLGRRRWQLGGPCGETSALSEHPELRLLADFEPLEQWVLEPGDILYVPPGISHRGIAVGDDCMTYSVGFRAPSRSELIAGFTEDILAAAKDDDRYTDPDPLVPSGRGEIASETIDRLHAMVTDALRDRAAFARWFGAYNTRPKDADIDWRPDEPLTLDVAQELMAEGTALLRNPAVRLAFIRRGKSVDLFADGECFPCAAESAAFAEHLCSAARVPTSYDMAQCPPTTGLVVELANRGAIAFETDD